MKFLRLLPIGLLLVSTAVQAGQTEKNRPVDFSQVAIDDPFWSPRLARHASATLIACIDQCENNTHRIRNFAIAAGREEGEFKGIFYDDSDVYKMIEGIAYSLATNPDPALEARTDRIIDFIAGAQREDGYLMTYYILGRMDQRWTDMDKHEMYCAGHLMEAAIAYYNATGKDKLLKTAVRLADYFDATFGEGKRVWVPGHQEIELALVKLYRLTGTERYLHLAHWLLEQRGHDSATWKAKSYYQDMMPVRDLESISGHAVRAMYMFTGMADVSAALGNDEYLEALDRLWDDVVGTKMYLTGGIGSSRHNEGFTTNYDLPNREAYCETCASVGMVFWNQRMNMFKGEGRYADVMERCMYNGALSGISLSGDRFFYVNPLESLGDHHRKPWYGTACCPSQISRFLPSIGNYIYAVSDDALWINMFISSSTGVEVAGNRVNVKMEGNYPWSGDMTVSVDPERKSQFALKVRIPGWCRNWSFSVNGQTAGAEVRDGYLTVDRTWKRGDKLRISFDMPVEVVEADWRVEADRGKRAIMRGPLVYCLEETDNALIDSARLTPSTTYSARFEPSLLGGVEVIEARTPGGTLRFVPYYAWDNREAGKMKVWVDYGK